MKQITTAQELHEAIEELEQRKTEQLLALEHNFSELYENLKPANLIKNTLHNAFSSGDSKMNLLKAVIGLGTGFLSRKLIVGKSIGVFRKALGAAVEFGVVGLVAKNAEKIKEKGSEVINKLFKKNKRRDIPDRKWLAVNKQS